MNRILITRTEPGASELAKILGDERFSPIVSPFHAIVVTDEACPLKGPDIWVFLSVHAVHCSCSGFWRHARVVFAIGGATATALSSFGVRAETPNERNSEGLRELINRQASFGMSCCIVSGIDGRDVLQKWLEEDGYDVATWRVYARQQTRLHEDVLNCSAVEVSSVSALRRLSSIWSESNSGYDEPMLIVPSDRIRAEAFECGFTRIHQATDASPGAVAHTVHELFGI